MNIDICSGSFNVLFMYLNIESDDCTFIKLVLKLVTENNELTQPKLNQTNFNVAFKKEAKHTLYKDGE